MNASDDSTERSDRRMLIATIVLAALLITGFIAKLVMEAEKLDNISVLQESKLVAERLLGDKLQLEGTVHELGSRMETCAQALKASEARVEELQRKLDGRGKRALTTQAVHRGASGNASEEEFDRGYQAGRGAVAWGVSEPDRNEHDVR